MSKSVSEKEQFFAVFVPGNSPSTPENDDAAGESPLVFREMAAVLDTMRKLKDKSPRFKHFACYDEALRFAQGGDGPDLTTDPSNGDECAGGDSRPGTPRPTPQTPADELPRPFSAPTPPQLTAFKKAIESKDTAQVLDLIESNPRYLINCNGDTPTILQVGYRYNALHIAARIGHLDTVKAVVEIFKDETSAYVRRLYPDDHDIETTSNRRRLLLDFYLNTPDKGFNETPLHFATKNCHLDLVKYLCSIPECQRSLVNKSGETAKDVAKVSDRIPDKTRKEMINILDREMSEFYIPLYRARQEANVPILCRPCRGFPSMRLKSEKETEYRLAAYIGPVDEDIADILYTQWASKETSPKSNKTPSKKKSSAKSRGAKTPVDSAAIKRSDLHKGMERIGRMVAANGNDPWMEYWKFMDVFTDLRSENGLKVLENYFQGKVNQEQENNREKLQSRLDQEVKQENCVKKLDFSEDGDSSRDSTDLYFDAEENAGGGDSAVKRSPNHFSDDTESESKDGFFTPPQELTANVIYGQEPTKLDLDVYATLEMVKIDETRFPHTAAWLNMIRDYSDEERRQWVPLDSPRSVSLMKKKLSIHQLPISPCNNYA